MKVGDKVRVRGFLGHGYEIVGITGDGRPITAKVRNGLIVGEHRVWDDLKQIEIFERKVT